MADLPTIGGAGLVGAVGAFLGNFVAGLMSGKKEQPAAAPQPSLPQRSPTVPDAEIDALRGRLGAVEDRIERSELRAQAFREKVLTKLARIFERLKISEENDDGRGSQ